jgi:hypothetical protein
VILTNHPQLHEVFAPLLEHVSLLLLFHSHLLVHLRVIQCDWYQLLLFPSLAFQSIPEFFYCALCSGLLENGFCWLLGAFLRVVEGSFDTNKCSLMRISKR